MIYRPSVDLFTQGVVMFQKILVPTDGSELSKLAIDKAVCFAAEIDAHIIGLTVTEPFHVVSTDGVVISDTAETYEIDMQRLADQRLKPIQQLCGQLEVDCEVFHKIGHHPYDQIVITAEKEHCDIIFMASHGRKGFSALLIGSEVNKVLTHTQIPVLVFR